MGEGYDAQQVCLNGHQTTANYYSQPDFRKKHCRECGAPTIHQCPGCMADIKGRYHVSGFLSLSPTPAPLRCDNCGSEFPWTKQFAARKANDAVTALPPNEAVARICSRFPFIARQLRHRHGARETLDVGDEYDVQDLLHGLLLLFFDDVRSEEVVPSYAGKSTRMDFLLKDESIVIEAKMTRKGLGEKEVGEQLILDISQYQSHPNCKQLYCLVYDPEYRVKNPRGLEKDLSKKHGDLDVKVYVVS